MNLKIWVSILIFLINYQTIYGQILSCSYRNDTSYGYTCVLTIQNPNGLNNFTGINGTHLTGKSNNDVRHIYNDYRSNTINIPSIICETFQYATRIVLQSIGIQTVDEYSFKSCKNLLYLSLAGNKISKFDEKSFSEKLELQTVHVNNNQLTTLPANVFANQQKLKELWLYRNKITDLPENIFHSLTNLTILDMDNNQIKNLSSEWFKNLHKLYILYLFANQIEELPKNVFSSLKELTLISLGRNKLKVIHSDSFGISPNLTEVYFGDNQINAIDVRFIDNTGVQQLDMTNNSCANANIFDNSTSRQSMRNTLQTCFNNYKTLYPGMRL